MKRWWFKAQQDKTRLLNRQRIEQSLFPEVAGLKWVVYRSVSLMPPATPGATGNGCVLLQAADAALKASCHRHLAAVRLSRQHPFKVQPSTGAAAGW